MKIDIRSAKSLKDITRLRKQLPDRMEALQSMLTFTMAAHFYEELVQRIPSSKEYTDYKQSIQLVTTGGADSVFAVIALPSEFKVDGSGSDKSIITVAAKHNRNRAVPPKIKVLEDHNPWTVDTLPFTPSSAEATLVMKPADPREAARVARARKKDAPVWRGALVKLGVRVSKHRALPETRTSEDIPDVVFKATRLEFGLDGEKQKAHWRPALSKISAYGSKTLSKQSVLTSFMDLADNRWKTWPPSGIKSVSIKEIQKLDGFQKLLGVS